MESDGLPFGASYQILFSLLSLFKHDISIEVLWAVIVVLVLLLFSALISGSEIAFFSFGEPDIEVLKFSENSKDAEIINVLEDKKKLLATILISNNFINVGIIIVSNFIISQVFEFGNNDIFEILINVVLVTTFLVFFGEVMPKLLASKNNLSFARFTLPMVNFFQLIFFPFAFLLAKFGNFLDSKIEKRKNSIDLVEIEKAIDLGVDENTKDKDKKILKGIVHFGNTTVKQIMKPRVDIFTISIEEEFHAVLRKIQESGFSRIPVFGEDIDDVKGVLYIKDLLSHLSEPNSFKWQDTLRTPDFTSESKKIDDLLKEMQLSKQHMSIVVDEYGGTEGLITLEDILEEVVGEINDEFDQSKKATLRNVDGSFTFEGKTPLIDVCKTTNVDMDTFEEAKGESDTLAGLVLEINENMPEEGKTIYFNNYEFKIIEISKNRIKKINVKINND